MQNACRSHRSGYATSQQIQCDPLIAAYLRDIAAIPPMCQGEATQLGEIIADPHSSEALRDVAIRRLIEGHLRFIPWAISRLKVSSAVMDMAEALAAANLALIEAAPLFDPSKGRFPTFLFPRIAWALRKSIFSHASVKISEKYAMVRVHMDECITAFYNEHMRHPSWEEIAEKTGYSLTQIQKAPVAMERDIADSLEDLMEEIDEADEGYPWEPCCESDEETGCSPVLSMRAQAMWNSLDPREQTILARRLGLETDEEETLQVIADDLGITRERVRQLEERAMKKARHPKWGLRPTFQPDDMPTKLDPPVPPPPPPPPIPFPSRSIDALGLSKGFTAALKRRWGTVGDLSANATFEEVMRLRGVGYSKALLLHRVLLNLGLSSRLF